jgi:hypothetical protein
MLGVYKKIPCFCQKITVSEQAGRVYHNTGYIPNLGGK